MFYDIEFMAKLDDRLGLVFLPSARLSATGQPRQPTIPSMWLMRRLCDQRQLEGGCRCSDLFEKRTVLARHHAVPKNLAGSAGRMAPRLRFRRSPAGGDVIPLWQHETRQQARAHYLVRLWEIPSRGCNASPRSLILLRGDRL